MKRPLLYALVFFVFGIVIGQYLFNPVSIALFFTLIIFICIGLFIQFQYRPVFLFLIFAIAGLLMIRKSILPKDAMVESFLNEEITITGVVKDVSYTKTGRQKIICKTKNFNKGEIAKASTMKILAYLEEGESVLLNQELKLQGTLIPLERKRNQGAFDEFIFYRGRKIQYKMFSTILEKNPVVKNSFGIYSNRLKNKLIQVYDTVLPEREAAIIKSMIIGDSSGLDDYISTLYRMAGIYHILAISGSHITIIALCLSRILNLFLGKRYSGILVLLVLIFYCFLTGSSVSTVRAVVMYGVIMMGGILNRDAELINSTAFTALALLLYEPLFLFDIGYQLSFSSVFGIAIFTKPLERFFVNLKEKYLFLRPVLNSTGLRQLLCPSLAAFLGNYPVSNYHFYYFLPYSIVVNIIILTTASAVLVLGIAVGIIGLISMNTAIFFSGVVFILLKIYEYICRFFVSLPFSTVLTGSSPIYLLCLYSIVLGFFFYWLYGRGGELKKRKRYFVIAFSVFAIINCTVEMIPKNLTVTMLDVGQGESIVIEKDDYTFVIDGGGQLNKLIGENTGNTVLTPFLDYKGISSVNAVFVSHSDYDHIAGIIELIENKKIDKIFLPEKVFGNEELIEALKNSAKEYKIPIESLHAGGTIKITDDFTISCVYPFMAYEPQEPNDSSLVLKMTYKDLNFLFTGDIGSEIESDLVNQDADLAADILKIAHHGSKNSANEEFYRRVKPKAAIISAGKNNMYGHPHEETVEMLEKFKIPFLDTKTDGAIIISTDGKRMKLENVLKK